MSGVGDHSAACCNVPPAQAEYTPKGDYLSLNGRKVYSTGSPNASRGILYIFDIFGFSSQILQGADILATSDSEKEYQVFIPDFFDGHHVDVSAFPPDTEEKKAALNEFFSGTANPQKTAEILGETITELTRISQNRIKEWAVVGFCWGGKVVSITAGENAPYKVAAICHPAFIDPEDAKKYTVPVAVLASKDEDAEAVKKFDEALPVEKHVETFGDMIHGWMAARADLSVQRNSEEYTRGYETVLNFFHKYM